MSELKDNDPFTPENAVVWQLIVQMRIYDVLMGIMNKLDEKSADIIYEAHQAGRLVSDFPRFGFVPEERMSNDNV